MRNDDVFGKGNIEKSSWIREVARPIFIAVFALFCLVFIWPVDDGFPIVVTVDASNNLGNFPDVLRPGLAGAWSENSMPLSSQLAFNKKPFWRLSIGIGWDENSVKPADFDQNFQNWLRNTVDPNIKKYQDAGYQTVISINQMPKWLSLYPSDECLPSNAEGCWLKWQYSPPNDYSEWKRLLQLLVNTQKKDGIKADYIIWDEPNWMFYGTQEQYLELYKNSVEAIKGIDGSIKVGALGVGCWSCKKDTNCPAQITGLPDGECNVSNPILDTMIKEQIKYVSANNVHMDFIDWHFPDLPIFKQEIDTTKNWLTTYGLDSALPLTIGEWVFSPSNEDESTEKAAAHTIYLINKFIDNGIYRHSATSIYDQSGWANGDWAHVGFFSEEGVIKTKWNSFKVLDRLHSQRLKVSSDSGEYALPTIASRDNNKIAAVLANQSSSQQVTFVINNLTPGTYTYRKYTIDGNMDEIHSNPCRYNKKTEFSPSTSDCGVNGAIDQAIAKAINEAENATTSYMVSSGISQQNANNLFVCYNDPACNIENYIKTYCQNNATKCTAKRPVILEAQQLYKNLLYHGKYRINSGRIYSTSTYVDQINNLKEISLEGSKQEEQVTVSGTYTEVINMLPYSVILIELLQ